MHLESMQIAESEGADRGMATSSPTARASTVPCASPSRARWWRASSGLPKHFAELGQFLLREVALALLLRILLNVPAGVGAVRAQTPNFGEVERLRQKLEASVGLDRREAEVVVKFGYIGPFDLAHPQVSDYPAAARR